MWDGTAAYVANDAVFHSASYWLALNANTASAPTPANINWQLMAGGLINRGAWNISNQYNINDVVSDSGSSWLAVQVIPADTVGSQPSLVHPSWQLLAAAGTGASGVTSVTASAPLTSSGGATPNISLAGVLPVANGGTGSDTKNFVDLTTNQTVAGIKQFSDQMRAPILYDVNNTGYYVDPASTSNVNALRFNVADCINGTCPPNNAIRMTPNFHLNSGAGYAVILNWDNGTTGANQTFRIGNGMGSDSFYVYADGQAYTTNWWRSIGNTGWYNQTYGGGWHMTDSTWIRAYNGKSVYMEGGYDSGSPAGVACGGGKGGGSTFQVCGSMKADIMYDRNNTSRRVDPDGESFLDYVTGNIFRARSNGNGDIFIGTQDVGPTGLLPGFEGGRYPTLGTSNSRLYLSVANTYTGYWQTDGYHQVSDERLKKDISELGAADFRGALADLDKIRSVRYRYKQEAADAPLHLGVIAQSLPDSVKRENKDLGVFDMSHGDMLGFLVTSVRGVRNEAQEAQQQTNDEVRRLQQVIEALNARIETLEKLVSQMSVRTP